MKLAKTAAIVSLALTTTLTAGAAHACKTYIYISNGADVDVKLTSLATQPAPITKKKKKKTVTKNFPPRKHAGINWANNILSDSKGVVKGKDGSSANSYGDTIRTIYKKNTDFRVIVFYRKKGPKGFFKMKRHFAASSYHPCGTHHVSLK